MSSEASPGSSGQPLAVRLYESTSESVAKCYQCGKCSAGCPLAPEMDHPPSQIIRMLQLGFPSLEEQALGSRAIWYCLTCETCMARCPQEVDLPRIMAFLREESMRRNKVNPEAKEIVAFHKAFLDSVQVAGRAYEIGMIADYKARSFHLFQDMLVAPKLFLHGKLKPFPHLIKGRSNISKIFSKTIGKKE
jgi:heterodisulfide reductase subunit C